MHVYPLIFNIVFDMRKTSFETVGVGGGLNPGGGLPYKNDGSGRWVFEK